MGILKVLKNNTHIYIIRTRMMNHTSIYLYETKIGKKYVD